MTMTPVRRLAIEASSGATDFGEYFTYFSFFLVVSALLLAVLFFRLGVEQRLRQIGILRAAGFTMATMRRLLLAEALVLAAAGSALGVVGRDRVRPADRATACARGGVAPSGRRCWTLHVSGLSLAIGGIAGVLAAAVCVFVSLAPSRDCHARALLTAQAIDRAGRPRTRDGARRRRLCIADSSSRRGAGDARRGFVTRSAQTGMFFGAGAALLVAVSVPVLGAGCARATASADRADGTGRSGGWASGARHFVRRAACCRPRSSRRRPSSSCRSMRSRRAGGE